MTVTVCRNDRGRHLRIDGDLAGRTEAAACAEAFATNDRIVISAAAVAEALIVAERRGLGAEMAGLVDGLDLEIANVSLAMARRVVDTCARWGKGVHPAGLNFGDCFAYEVARTRDCPLFYESAFARSRSVNFCTFPVDVFGSGPNTTVRGVL